MERFLVVENNKIVSERFAESIVEGEIYANITHENAQVGMVLLDGVWQRDPKEIELQAKQQRLAELTKLIQEAKLLDEPYQEYIDEYKAIKESL